MISKSSRLVCWPGTISPRGVRQAAVLSTSSSQAVCDLSVRSAAGKASDDVLMKAGIMSASNSPAIIVTSFALAAAFAFAIGTAHAATPTQSATSVAAPTMAACNQLPASRRELCRSEAAQAQLRAAQAAANHTLSNSQKAALKKADAHYRAAVAACNRMPLSDRTTCVSEAGDDRALAATE
jgi:hypothetical protein